VGHTENTESTEGAENASRLLTEQIIGAAIEVHRVLGPGLLESAYEQCLAHELAARGLSFRRQVDVPVTYKGLRLDAGFRADFIVDDSVVVEIKAVESLMPVHTAQVVTYLRLTGKHVGLLINFNSKTLKEGLKRVISQSPSPP
jgi:GxxExxY protein